MSDSRPVSYTSDGFVTLWWLLGWIAVAVVVWVARWRCRRRNQRTQNSVPASVDRTRNCNKLTERQIDEFTTLMSVSNSDSVCESGVCSSCGKPTRMTVTADWAPADCAEDGRGPESARQASISVSRSICAICLEPYGAGDTLRVLPCLHCFHAGCIKEWMLQNCRCPTCRDNICHHSSDVAVLHTDVASASLLPEAAPG
jgi:hypothetical protein